MRRLLTVLAFSLVTATAFAQEVAPVLVTLPQVQRQGTYLTGSYAVPTEMTGYLRVLVQIDAADHLDDTKSIWVRIYVLMTEGEQAGQWVYIKGMQWKGATGTAAGDKVGTAIPVVGWALNGRQIRAEIDLPERMRVGCVVDNPQNPITQ